MKTWLSALGLLLLAVPAGRAADVNFQISSVAQEAPEGPSRLRYYFEAGHRRMMCRPPFAGRITSSPDGITIFLNKNGMNGEIHVVNSALLPNKDFVAGVDEYRAAAEKSLPRDAEKAEYLGGKADLIPVNHWKSMGFEWTYSASARPTHRQVIFLNIDELHQVCITMVSDEEYWKETAGAAKQFISTWYWLTDEAK